MTAAEITARRWLEMTGGRTHVGMVEGVRLVEPDAAESTARQMAKRDPYRRALVKISEHRSVVSVAVLAEIMTQPENASKLRAVREGVA